MTANDDTEKHADGMALLAAQTRSARTEIYEAKLRPAVSPAYQLPRPRLLALLDETVQAPLTLVAAPAGSGKTSLLRSWVSATALPHAWLSLDETDRDAVQLWRGVLAALEEIAPGCATPSVGLLRRPGGLLEAVGALLDDLEARAYDARVLVIDDLQLVDDDERVAASLALFVQHLPRWLHVVMASRRSPRLPVNRLRARGQLGEVHFAELRFSFEEATAMLARLAPSLDPVQVREVAAAAGGWAASLQLAALAARSALARGEAARPLREDEHHYLEDYIWQEVLASESDELVDVLLATSVVERVDPGLAQVLASRPDAVDLLARAEERGLFVSRIEPSGSFEMHGLVREVLLSMLAKRSPERLRHLHAWAAGWHQAHGHTVTALEHWLRSDRPRDALRLLAAEVGPLADGGHESTILRTIAAIPDEIATSSLTTMMDFAWCHLPVDRRRFVSLTDHLTRWARDDLELDPVVAARLEVLQSMAAMLRGHWSEGTTLARSALQGFGDGWWLDPLGRFSWTMISRDVALSERWDESQPETQQVIRALGAVPERRATLEGTRALAEALAGRPMEALRFAAGTRQASEVGSMTILRSEVLTAETIAHREVGDLAEALPRLFELCADRLEPAPHCQLLASLELTKVRLDEGNLEAASRAFEQATELVETEMSGPGSRSWLAASGTVLALAAGEVEEARGWSEQVVDPFWSRMCTTRVLLASGERGLAADVLKGAEPRSIRQRVLADLLGYEVLSDREAAEQCLLEAVRTASRNNLVQTVASEGLDVVEAVERLAWRAPQPWLDRLRRAVVPGVTAPVPSVPGPVEQLTERELVVLRMLPSRLTLREIADELFISINTLKFHLKVIYRKLDCTSRAEAAEVARSLASLHRR